MDAGLPGKNGDCRQHSLIKSIFAACESAGCDGGTRHLEDWVGKSSGAVNRVGRPAICGGKGILACLRGGGRCRRGQRRGEAARPAAQAAARAQGGSRPRQAPQGGRTLPPENVRHKLA